MCRALVLALFLVVGCRRAHPAAAALPSLPRLIDHGGAGRLVPVPELSSRPDTTPVLPTAGEPLPILVDRTGAAFPVQRTEAPPASAPAPARDVPPEDGLEAVFASLGPEARATAPDPATLPFYDVTLRVEPRSGQLEGSERIDDPVSDSLSVLPLRIFANSDAAHVQVRSVRIAGVDLAFDSPDPTLVDVHLPAPAWGPVAVRRLWDSPSLVSRVAGRSGPTPAQPGRWLHLDVTFDGTAPAPSEAQSPGMLEALLSPPGRSADYGLFSTFDGGIALAEFLPMLAGHWNGALDVAPPTGVGDSSYFDLSSFRVAIDLPAGYTVAAPGAQVSETLRPGRHEVTMALADARDFAIFASRRYREVDRAQGGVLVRSIYQDGQGDPGRSVLSTAASALALFGKLYHPYPYTTYTAVEVPLRGGAGGAEFPALVAVAGMAYGEAGALPGGMAFSGDYLAALREFVVAHETAHQWWACAVASQPRLQPDVDEPLAQFSAAVYVGHLHGEGARREVLSSQVGVNYQAMRMLGQPDGPAARGTGDFANVTEYAGLVYGKAPLFYQAAAARYGDAAVSRGLEDYARRHFFGIARRGDVVASLAAGASVSKDEVQRLFDRWFRQAHGDQDLKGVGDVNTVAAEAFGGGSGGLDLGALLQQGGAATGKLPPPPAQSPNVPGVDPQQALQLLQQINKTMGGVDDSPQ